jgi:serine/threonine protein kinase
VGSEMCIKTARRTFLAIDLQTELPVVIKLLIFNNEFIWDDLKLFEREAETLKHLDLPAIPRYLDYSEFDLPNLKGFALEGDSGAVTSTSKGIEEAMIEKELV